MSTPERHAQPDPRWLDDQERRAWVTLIALTTSLPASLDAQMQRDAGMSFFEYTVLARLAERDDRTAQMSELAVFVNGSLSRLSHVARRLESRGYLTRRPMPSDGRITIATLTDDGLAAVQAAAPLHVEHVRRIIFDNLTTAGADIPGLFAGVLRNIAPGVAGIIGPTP